MSLGEFPSRTEVVMQQQMSVRLGGFPKSDPNSYQFLCSTFFRQDCLLNIFLISRLINTSIFWTICALPLHLRLKIAVHKDYLFLMKETVKCQSTALPSFRRRKTLQIKVKYTSGVSSPNSSQLVSSFLFRPNTDHSSYSLA